MAETIVSKVQGGQNKSPGGQSTPWLPLKSAYGCSDRMKCLVHALHVALSFTCHLHSPPEPHVPGGRGFLEV